MVNITDVFHADFQEGAHSRQFDGIGLPVPLVRLEVHSDVGCEEQSVESMIDGLRALLQTANVDYVTTAERDELGGIFVLLVQIFHPRGNVTEWINDVYLRSGDLDLGTFNANLISVVFAEQSRKWGRMTKVYMSRVIVTLHIVAALRSVCPDDLARGQLWSTILESIVERYQIAIDQASLLIDVERRKQPYTLNRQFPEARSKARGRNKTSPMLPCGSSFRSSDGIVGGYSVSLPELGGFLYVAQSSPPQEIQAAGQRMPSFTRTSTCTLCTPYSIGLPPLLEAAIACSRLPHKERTTERESRAWNSVWS